METTQETTTPFKNLVNAIDKANISAIDRMSIYDALAKYIENDAKIINNLNNNTWNADTKQS
jgi:hypothetical protein